MTQVGYRHSIFGLRMVFLTMAIVLVVSVLSAYFMGRLVVKANEAVIGRHTVVDHLVNVLSTMKDAETGQRGYLLTGDDQYLAPFDEAKNRIDKEVDFLSKLAPSNDISAEDISRYRDLIHSKIAELDQTVNLRRSGHADSAIRIVRTDAGKKLMDDVRSLNSQLIDRQNAKLDSLNDRARWLNLLRTEVYAIVTFVNLGFIYWAYRRIRNESINRQLAADDLMKQKELLRVTLASIGDAVIVTDKESRITFLNHVAEELTGWSAEEALGQPCTAVFNIINEATRKLVESPVDKVLRLGVIVGLANHTVLIRKDGTEVPIDDSGAPISESDGTVRGVVLVFRDFSEHKRAETELRQAKETAEAANIAKDNFLATLSHELRTPLTPVVATLSEWEVNQTFPGSFLPDVQMMRRNVELEARLIDDLLDLTRIVRGKLSLTPEVADIHDLVTSVTQMYQSDIRAKRLQLVIRLDAQKHFVFADPGRLQQVFWNILKNATKFTPEGGRIALNTTNDQQGNVVVGFQDSGIGISQETLAKLFRPFEQGDDENIKRYGGLGLGMAISKALMDAQGGTITAQSEGVGRGSIFTVALPCVGAPDRKQAPTTAPRMVNRQRSLKILLVEDHGDTAEVIGRLLRSLGHNVSFADSVHSALASASAVDADFDLFISDIGLPDGTGIDFVKELRKTRETPAVALTGFGMEDDIADCKAAGFNEHLTKPVSIQKLEMVLSQFSNHSTKANGS